MNILLLYELKGMHPKLLTKKEWLLIENNIIYGGKLSKTGEKAENKVKMFLLKRFKKD